MCSSESLKASNDGFSMAMATPCYSSVTLPSRRRQPVRGCLLSEQPIAQRRILLQDHGGKLALEILDALAKRGIRGPEDPHGQQSRVAGAADRYGGHGHTGR